MFQDTVKNTAPRWRMKSPIGFGDFLATLCPALLLQNTPLPQPSPPPATAAAFVVVAAITVIVPSVVTITTVVLMLLPLRLPLPLLVDCSVLYEGCMCQPPSLSPPTPALCCRRLPHHCNCCCRCPRHHSRYHRQCHGSLSYATH